jgi:hypothetical protein
MTVVEPNLTATSCQQCHAGQGGGDRSPGVISSARLTINVNNVGNSTAYDVNVVIPAIGMTFYSGFVRHDHQPHAGERFVATPAGAPAGPLVWGRGNGDGRLDIPVGGSLVLTYRAGTRAPWPPSATWPGLTGPRSRRQRRRAHRRRLSDHDRTKRLCYGPTSVTTTYRQQQ